MYSAQRLEQRHRVEVRAVALRAPVQAVAGRAAGVIARHRPNGVPPLDRLPRPHRRGDRFVLGAHAVGMRDHDNSATGHRAREAHHAGPRRPNGGAGGRTRDRPRGDPLRTASVAAQTRAGRPTRPMAARTHPVGAIAAAPAALVSPAGRSPDPR